MQRLDGERHLGRARVRQDSGKAVGDHFMGRAQVARAFGQTAADEHDALAAEHGRLVDHALVVVDDRLPLGGGRSGKQAAAAIAGDAQVVVLDEPRRLLQADTPRPCRATGRSR